MPLSDQGVGMMTDRNQFLQFVMPGDVIVAVNGSTVKNLRDEADAFARLECAVARATTNLPQVLTVLLPVERARRALMWQRAHDLYDMLES